MAIKNNQLLSFVILLAFTIDINAQELAPKPIPIELVLGNNRIGLQSIINKNLPENNRFTFFSVTNFESELSQYANGLDFINNSQISYEIYKGFALSTGGNFTKVTGLSPTMGLQYVFANPSWLFVATPNLIFTTGTTASILAILEYKPTLTNQLTLYSRIQCLYNHNFKSSTHKRSYVQIRMGIEYKKYQFGLASNIDYFGPDKSFKENYGVFMRTNL
jgi:hypothetical protein